MEHKHEHPLNSLYGTNGNCVCMRAILWETPCTYLHIRCLAGIPLQAVDGWTEKQVDILDCKLLEGKD